MMRIFSTGGKMDTQAVITHIARWLDEYAAQANAKGFVVGVSGGIDSAVVSALAARTGRTTLLLDMPIRQHPSQLERARLHIRNLQGQYANVSAQTADLTDTFQTFEQTVGVHQTAFANQPLSLANARSRLRMLTLYYYGQIHGLLVTGTGNKIEDFGVGFFTKYGDGGVDISPIADLTKTQVYRLAKKPRRPTACGIRNAPTRNRWAQAIPNWSGQWACTARANPKILKGGSAKFWKSIRGFTARCSTKSTQFPCAAFRPNCWAET